MHGGDMHTHLLEQAAPHHPHHPAALVLAVRRQRAAPGGADEGGGLAGVERRGGLAFQRLEARNDPYRQLFEPGAGGGFAGFQLIHRRVGF